MIRRLNEQDIDQVMTIWLYSNIKTHDYIPKDYWKSNENDVKKAIIQAETYVYIDDSQPSHPILGFIGLIQDYIAGIFVKEEWRNQGIGKQLLNWCKEKHSKLELKVYMKNEKAIRFYEREGFKLINESIDENNNEKEYLMKWAK
ncbi:acyl-CoA N-acyltransferase [Anaeromyces robustus]|uniref:Acyl-CoA N-acyltransferase n=1 Tax=Anaeromyces robustus TaxID=1754192 RepID=A0A1Y1WQY9_9FUNG|nr:acyl-CoA N-acyltransferase [Anaeromyces robustus]|eukprot:ORX75708.1 acyl-CoA N-acyltransferase [Anaeromyces robustus]